MTWKCKTARSEVEREILLPRVIGSLSQFYVRGGLSNVKCAVCSRLATSPSSLFFNRVYSRSDKFAEVKLSQ